MDQFVYIDSESPTSHLRSLLRMSGKIFLQCDFVSDISMAGTKSGLNLAIIFEKVLVLLRVSSEALQKS